MGNPVGVVLIGKLLTDPLCAVDFLHIGAPLIGYLCRLGSGSIGGGWFSSSLLIKGWPVARARKAAMLICALCVAAVIFVPKAAGNLWLTVTLIGSATAAHQGWSANLFTVASDNSPRVAVGSIV